MRRMSLTPNLGLLGAQAADHAQAAHRRAGGYTPKPLTPYLR